MPGIFRNQGVWGTGCDFLPTAALVAGGVFDAVLNAPNVSAAYARFAGKGIQFPTNSYAGRSFGVNLASHIGGFAYMLPSLPTGSIIAVIATWMDTVAGLPQVSLGANAQGALQFYQTGGLGIATVLTNPIGPASATGLIVAGAYNMYEFKLTIDPVTGFLQLRINGAVVITFSGNTRTTANSYINQLRVGSLAANVLPQMDDLYLLDTTAPVPLNDYLGNGRFQTDGPTQGSATSGLNQWAFTTPAGSDFANAANIPANPAQFNSNATVGDRMSFRFPALTVQKAMFLNAWISALQDAAGTRQITPQYRSNNIDQAGDPISLSNGSYVYSNQASIIDPNTGLLWASEAASVAGACEIGVQTTT